MVADLKPQPRASVVIVNHNGGAFIGKAVASVLRQGYGNVELVLIDNASTDGSLERALALPRPAGVELRLVRSSDNLGCAGGRNRGVHEATGEFVVFLDDDAIAPAGWLAALDETLERNPSCGIVASTSLSWRNPTVIQSAGGFLNLQGYAADQGCGESTDVFDAVREPVYAMGNGMTVRREVFEAVGGFDEGYHNYYEDVDFCLRARLAGFGVAVELSQPLLHYGGHSDRGYGAKNSLLERNRIRTVVKHYDGEMLRRWGREELRMAWTSENREARAALLRAWAWNLLRLPALLRARRPHQPRIGRDHLPGFLDSWGLLHSRYYNLQFIPGAGDLDAGTNLGDHDTSAIVYGFYYPESTLGETCRWSDEVACLRLRTSRHLRRLVIRMLMPEDYPNGATGCFVYLLDRGSDRSFESRIQADGGLWTDVELEVDIGPGTYDLVFQPERCSREATGWRRQLGIAVAAVRGLESVAPSFGTA